MKHYLGIDIGGTAVKLGIVDEAGAFALVVGGAITRPAEITARFTGAINAAKK